MTFDPENSNPPGAKIKVIGVGGGGGNAVNTMIRSGLDGVDFITCNTDVQALRYSLATHKIQIGKELTRGLGAGADPDIGRDAALEDKTEIQNILRDADMVFITAGMGGGTGTGGAAVVAQFARELGALTVAVVTKPFTFEGKRRKKQAEAGIARLRESVDTLITIPNQRLLQVASPDLSMIDAFKMADEVLVNAVRGISDIINIHGMLNVDFADVKTVMSCMGQALMGIGSGRGDKRAVEAALMAISSPLLEEVDIEGATGILINITGGTRITMHEINEACGVIQEAAHEDANIIFGAVIDETLGDELRVTVIATGFPVDKAESDADPNKGKPYPSTVAGRLASVAGKHASQPAAIEKELPKNTQVTEPPLEIEDIPQSPYDDLAFAKKSQSAAKLDSHEILAASAPVMAATCATEIKTENPQYPHTHAHVSGELPTAAPEESKPGPQAVTFSAAHFATSSAEEAQELARWTLDFTSTGGLTLAEDIPSLAAPLVEDSEDLGASEADHLQEVSLSTPVDLAPSLGLNEEVTPESISSVPSSHEHESVHATTLHMSLESDHDSHTEVSDLEHSNELENNNVIIDPKDEFVSAVSQTMASSSLADTLFDAELTSHFDQEAEASLAALDSIGTETSSEEDKIQLESPNRQGATKGEPSYPAAPLHEDFDLAEIDRKIDEALELADRMRASRQKGEADDLDIPSFLRANMKDLPLD